MIKIKIQTEYLDFQLKNEYFIFLVPLLMLIGTWKIPAMFVVAFFCIFLLNNFKENKFDINIPYFLIWIILLIWGLYITQKSPSVEEGFLYFIGTILLPFIIFILFCNIKINKSFLEIFFNLLIASGVILSLTSYYEFYTKGFSLEAKIGGLWPNYNILSAYLMILFMFNLSFIINKAKNDKILLYVLSIILILFGIFLTQTRGVWLAIVFTIAIFIIRKPKIIIPSVFVIGILIFLFYSRIETRFLSIKYFGSDVSSLGRLQAWISSLILIKNNFLFGYGFDSYVYLRDSVFPVYFVNVIHSHNTYLRAVLEMGFIGFLLYFFFIFKAFIYTIKLSKNKLFVEYKKFIDGFRMSFIGLFIVFMFEPYFSLYGLSTFIIWILISIIFNLHKISINT